MLRRYPVWDDWGNFVVSATILMFGRLKSSFFCFLRLIRSDCRWVQYSLRFSFLTFLSLAHQFRVRLHYCAVSSLSYSSAIQVQSGINRQHVFGRRSDCCSAIIAAVS
jgi:hypothetical protein